MVKKLCPKVKLAEELSAAENKFLIKHLEQSINIKNIWQGNML